MIEILKDSEVAAFSGLKTVSVEEAVKRGLHNMNYRSDSGEGIFFARQLEQVLTQTFMTEYPEVKFRSFIPVSNEVANGAATYTWRMFDEAGKADLITDMSANFPSVDVEGAEVNNPIKSFGTSYHFSIQDLRNAAYGNVPQEAMRANTARRVMERLLDKLACKGDTKMGFSTGLSNATGILAGTKVSQKVGATWADASGNLIASPSEILEDVHGLCRKVFETTLGMHQVNTLLVGTKGFSLLASKPQSPSFTDQSVMSYILRMSPWIKSIQHWAQLDDAGSGSKERIVGYEKSPDVCRVMIPQEFEQFPPMPVNLSFKILCHMRYAGVCVFKPKAIAYLDGTQL